MFRTLRSGRGFTLIDIVVVLAVVAILAAVMTPAVVEHLEDSKTARAQKEVELIGARLSDFYTDLGRWPTDTDANKSITDQEVRLLESVDGTMPGQRNGNTGWTTLAPADNFTNQLILNRPVGSNAARYATTGEIRWKGPYVNAFTPDPWGRKYLCNVWNFWPGRDGPVWVISAGPDGVIDTPATQQTVRNDDIGFMLKR